MNVILLFGPQAVGKMTVGQELEKRMGYRLLHNHMTIDLLVPFFGFSDEMWRLSTLFREEIYRSVAKTNLPGFIFTFVWDFSSHEDWETVDRMCAIFKKQDIPVYFVELQAGVDTRLKRNVTENRLEHKPTKRNIAFSEADLLRTMETGRLQSREGEIKETNYLRIQTDDLSASKTAERIVQHFGLEDK
ncbi:DEAD/DEAH box helicase family protein [Terribacillus saccharophilus]|uniref:AAA family ATPase n=1 Tax=Terribacillus saccharophilus TaxID=361277 RepID=UPI002989C1D6|nr:AAA family ATPase [Terribacillus saccharophilus]MEC0284322.1 AAA family ATPase [Terribacillus saccharophilus]MEC0291000.1 AAA family ATPase [Terribacillus saccharophilus]